jgi:succinoglycan biosynthesis transport protein ExoP
MSIADYRPADVSPLPERRDTVIAASPRAAVSPAQDEPAVRALLSSLRRRLTVLMVVVIALPAGALAFSLTAQKEYTATAKLLFRDPGFDGKLFGNGSVLAPSVDPAREAATNLGLVSLDTVAAKAANSKAVKGHGLTADEIRAKVTIAAEGQSNVVDVSATDAQPAFSAALANTMARKYIAFRRDADRGKISQASALLTRQLASLSAEQRAGTEGKTLRSQIEQMRAIAALQTGNAELVQQAETPSSPSAPNTARNVILALILGLAIGVGLALGLDRLDRRLHDRDHVEALIGRPVLGVIPESSSLRADHGDTMHLGGREAESFRTLRANLRYYDIDRDIRSLLVTSSAPGDGKSTVARYLAATAAAANVSCVLVEADLRRPTLNGVYPVLRARGLSEVLTDQVELTQAIQRLPVSIAGAPTGKSLDVLSAGTPPPNPTDLLESDRMRAVLDELHARYELVIVDSSPITIVPDSIPVLSQVSGVLLVMREGRSTSVGARRLRDQLTHLGVAPLGIVMNGTPAVENQAAYGYYAYEPAAATPSSSGSLSARLPALSKLRVPALGRRRAADDKHDPA